MGFSLLEAAGGGVGAGRDVFQGQVGLNLYGASSSDTESILSGGTASNDGTGLMCCRC